MDVLNKLCSTVSSTVSQLSTVLPGNPVTREYEAFELIATAGPGFIWKIFNGAKRSTGESVSIFVLEKKSLERWMRSERESILDCARKGVSQLARLRHPQILVVQHTLEESRDCLAFATEPVFSCLANTLGYHQNFSQPIPRHLQDFKFSDIEIKHGLLQLAEGLSFLHGDVKLVHRNICPQNIIINRQGLWKLFGFEFSIQCVNSSTAEPEWPSTTFIPDAHHLVQPDLDYVCPEGIANSKWTPSGDMYSLGMTIYSIHNGGKSLISFDSCYHTYKSRVPQLAELCKLNGPEGTVIPNAFRKHVQLLLHHNPELRQDPHQFKKCDYFEDVCVKALVYLDSLFQWDNLQKSHFYKGLPQIVDQMPHRVALSRVVPRLSEEFVNPTMVPFVLPTIFSIAEKCSKDEFTESVLPHLKPIWKLTEPIQILLICMQKMELLLRLTPAEDIKMHVLPVLYRALETPSQQIQELCLSIIPTFAKLIDFSSMKNALLPRVKTLCIASKVVSVQVNCLICMAKLIENLDKWLILDSILPFLPTVPSRDPAVIMSIVGIYKIVLSDEKIIVPKELICGKILPFLIPLSVDSSLTVNQFNVITSIIKNSWEKVEVEHRAKLEQLDSIRKEHKNLQASSLGNGNMPMPSDGAQKELRDLFDAVPSVLDEKGISSLSLKEKQRISDERDYQDRSNKELLQPKKFVKKLNAVKCKDLTSSLIESNLNQIQRSSAPQNNNMFNSLPNSSTSNSMTCIATMKSSNSYNFSSNKPISSLQAQLPGMNNLAPGAFFNSSHSVMTPITPSPNVAQSTLPAKPLTFSEIDDFLN